MAEIVVGAVVTVLFEKLASAAFMKMARSEGMDVQLMKWKKTFSDIQLVLADAEQKQITNTSVQSWLHDLQDLAYDIDDVLDDMATEAMRRKLNKELHASSNSNTSKLLKLFPTCCTNSTPHNIIYGHKMSSKLEEISTKLHTLFELKNTLGLNVNVEKPKRAYKRLEETSLVEESKVMGREGDKEALLEKLLGKEEACNQNVSIVSIVGLGGIGKTTLAKVLYNKEEVKEHFELRAWVCVSEEFDVTTISKAIFQAVAGSSQEFANLDLLHVALKEKLSNKRFLVVLDDVWNEDYREWELLQSPFVVGAPGSKVMVTTRKTEVASVMNSFQPYDLPVLSEEKAMSLFARYALDEENFDKYPTLKSHGEGIVKKCGRLPLALITLGRVLRLKAKDDEWEEVLNSEIWNLKGGSQILPALRLSYYDLPSHLKQLFAYCSLFPKDHLFDKNKLVLLWMAQGFLNQSNGRKSKESLGREYFEELKSRSFFQTSSNIFGESGYYVMHDLINDLATSVAGEFFFRLDDKMDTNNMNESFEKFRHVSFIGEEYGTYRKFKELQRAKGLRTFLPVSLRPWSEFNLSNNVLAELLPQLQFVRVLSLSYHRSITKVPQSIASLKHIRYLNFSGTSIERLPEQVSDLYNLQSLLVSSCEKLSSLPSSFAKLINLRHLDINDTPILNKMPLGIGGLTGLQTLPKVIIEEGNGFKISELKGLSDLEGRLSIMGLDKVISPIEAIDAKLEQKKGVDDLVLKWSDEFDDSRDQMIDYKVLEGLRPQHKLRKLEIMFYGGMEFPSWVGDPAFDHLTALTLHGCRRCRHLPAALGAVEYLSISECDELRYLCESKSEEACKFFGSLRRLEIQRCKKLVSLGEKGVNVEISMKNVRLVDIRECESLESYNCPNSVERLDISNCDSLTYLTLSTMHELPSSLKFLRVGSCKKLVSLGEKGVNVENSMKNVRQVRISSCESLESYNCPNSVEDLDIRKCDSLTSLTLSTMHELPSSLKILRVGSCKKLVSLGEKGVNVEIRMKNVRQVHISDCESLESYNCPNSVERLDISNCDSLTYLTLSTMHELPSSLKILRVGSCKKLVSLGEKGVNVEIRMKNVRQVHISDCESLESYNCPNSVERLDISNCHSLTYLTLSTMHELPSSLKILRVGFCNNLEYISDKGFGIIPLNNLEISNCKNLKLLPIPHEHLESLTSLKELHIYNCPSMDYSFPCGLWPPNLRQLWIGRLNKPMSEWGILNYPTSLVDLWLFGEDSGVVSFVGNAKDVTSSSFLLPPSLTTLVIMGFKDVESVTEVLQHLPYLKELYIKSCPKLKDLPQTSSSLYITVW